jgi:hydrogenase/urease accessory protein HupE
MRRALAWLVAGALLLALPASAHLMSAGQGAVRLVGDSAYSVISVPVAALSGFDDNHDGLIDLPELNAHRAELSRQVAQLLVFKDGDVAGKLLFDDLLLSHDDNNQIHPADHLIAMQRYQWAAPVTAFSITCHLFEPDATASAQLLVRAISGARSEVALLSRQRSEVQFFAGPWATFRNFLRSGAEHILLGPDHLLFLLTALVVGAGWRYWLAMVTSFTLAHSITLTLSALGVVHISPLLIEPLIAASIVLLAITNLVRGAGAVKHRVAVVFACGLLHGLGLASALADFGLSPENRVLSLLGFNLGVEAGQMAFVAVMLGLLHLVRRSMSLHWHARFLQACSLLAAVVGCGWVIERTIVLF